jgi:hypothetical protein
LPEAAVSGHACEASLISLQPERRFAQSHATQHIAAEKTPCRRAVRRNLFYEAEMPMAPCFTASSILRQVSRLIFRQVTRADERRSSAVPKEAPRTADAAKDSEDVAVCRPRVFDDRYSPYSTPPKLRRRFRRQPPFEAMSPFYAAAPFL